MVLLGTNCAQYGRACRSSSCAAVGQVERAVIKSASHCRQSSRILTDMIIQIRSPGRENWEGSGFDWLIMRSYRDREKVHDTRVQEPRTPKLRVFDREIFRIFGPDGAVIPRSARDPSFVGDSPVIPRAARDPSFVGMTLVLAARSTEFTR